MLADCLINGFEIWQIMGAACFGDHGDAFTVCPSVDAERRHARLANLRRSTLDDRLDIGRVVVAAADDHQILQSAADEQLAVMQKADVSGSQVAGAAGLPGELRLE